MSKWNSAYDEIEVVTERPRQVPQTVDVPMDWKERLQAQGPAGIVVILLVIMAVWIWQSPPRKHVPDELVGQWHSDNPIYADRGLEFDDICVTFTTGKGMVSVGFIKDVKEVADGTSTVYTISYTLDGTPNEVSFYYDPSNGKSLWFKNQQKIVWKKDQGG
jgi:hypothetical protein